VAFAINPVFGTMAAAKVASKVFDYTIFRAAKELLYIPLSYVQKTRGKAVVDMLTYRVAKGGASLLLLILAAVVTQALVTGLTLAAIVAWIAITVAIVIRFRRRVSREEEMRGRT
jgi:ATP/ADP translocase